MRTQQEIKRLLFAKPGQYSEDQQLVKEISELGCLVNRGNGLHGGSHGTEIPYTDYQWGGNVIRLSGYGFSGQDPSVEVLDVSAKDYKENCAEYAQG